MLINVDLFSSRQLIDLRVSTTNEHCHEISSAKRECLFEHFKSFPTKIKSEAFCGMLDFVRGFTLTLTASWATGHAVGAVLIFLTCHHTTS